MLSEIVELFEVGVEELLMGVTRPPRYPVELLWAEWCHMAVQIESSSVGRLLGQAELHEAIERVGEPAALANTGPEAKGLRELAGPDLRWHLVEPQGGHPSQQQGGARADDSRPALLDVWVIQVESDPLHASIGVVDWGEAQDLITFHAPVGPSTGRRARGDGLEIW